MLAESRSGNALSVPPEASCTSQVIISSMRTTTESEKSYFIHPRRNRSPPAPVCPITFSGASIESRPIHALELLTKVEVSPFGSVILRTFWDFPRSNTSTRLHSSSERIYVTGHKHIRTSKPLHWDPLWRLYLHGWYNPCCPVYVPAPQPSRTHSRDSKVIRLCHT